MIDYTIDTNARPTVHFLIAAIALLLALLVGPIFSAADARWLAPSAFTLFGLAVFSFEKFFWKREPITTWLGVPNLEGEYAGTVERGAVGEENYERHEVDVTISQTWSTIQMILKSRDGQVASRLSTCGFFVARGRSPSFKYTYSNQDLKGHNELSKYGEGTAELFIAGEKGKFFLEGAYYGSKGRSGRVKLQPK